MKQNVLRNFSSSKGGFIHTYCPSSEKRNACLQTNKVEPNGHQLSIQKILMVYLLFMGQLKNRKCTQWHKNFAFKIDIERVFLLIENVRNKKAKL